MRGRLWRRLEVYVVTDERQNLDSLLKAVSSALEGGANVVQLRRKHDDGRVLVGLGREIRRLTRAHGALYIVNDRVDVAMLTDADGVHVGQTDIPCTDVRALVGNKLVGVSAATLPEALRAVRDGADYLGIGAIFATSTKEDADICGLSGLHCIAKEIKQVPIVAIGGITASNVDDVLATGADGVAVVSDVMQAENPKLACAALRDRVRRRIAASDENYLRRHEGEPPSVMMNEAGPVS